MGCSKISMRQKRSKFISFAIALVLIAVSASSQVRLPAIFSDHMVLQQQSEVKVWGWSEPNEKITLKTSWDTTTYHATGSVHANWEMKVKTPGAGGPYSIIIDGYNHTELKDVMIGEVWICSGQSNMEMNMNWGLPYEKELEHAENSNIRFFQVPKTTAQYPQNDVYANWTVSNAESMRKFSSVAYFFGKKLEDSLDLPVGLIHASWGGTPAETWTPQEIIQDDSVLLAAANKLSPGFGWPVETSLTYNAMIHPLINFSIAGAIWYQGESNVGTYSTYTQLFTKMIGGWRQAFKKELPFYFVQIAPFADYGSPMEGALLREAQTNASAYPGTGMVVISDLVDNVHDIHPKMKKEVGERLAGYALADTYHKNIIGYKSPSYKSMNLEKKKIRISFTDAGSGLISKGKEVTEFFIAGEDKNFVPAKAKIQGEYSSGLE
jgi:sialate O-acetylesterase